MFCDISIVLVSFGYAGKNFRFTAEKLHLVQGLKNRIHARVCVHTIHAKALWCTRKNVYANYFPVKTISQLENYLCCLTKTFFAVQD